MDSNTYLVKEKELQEVIIKALLLCSSYKNKELFETCCKHIEILKKFQEEHKELLVTGNETEIKARMLRDEIIDMLKRYIELDPEISFTEIRKKIGKLNEIEGKYEKIDDRDISKDIRKFTERDLREMRTFSSPSDTNNRERKSNIH